MKILRKVWLDENFVLSLQCKRVSPGGGIGRRARFRCECSKDVQVRFLSWALDLTAKAS